MRTSRFTTLSVTAAHRLSPSTATAAASVGNTPNDTTWVTWAVWASSMSIVPASRAKGGWARSLPFTTHTDEAPTATAVGYSPTVAERIVLPVAGSISTA